MADSFSRDSLATYEKNPQTKVSDKVNPFRGATPAKVADAAAVAAVAAGQIDATPGGAPESAQAEESLVDDAPVVDEDGTLGDPTESGEGTSDELTDPSTVTADPSGESDPETELTGEPAAEDADADAEPAPKKGSAAERIVEVLDLMEGYKIYGKAKEEQVKELQAELERLRPAAVQARPAPVVEVDEPMPDMADEDVAFDNDKYRDKMKKWVDKRTEAAADRVLRRASESQAQAQAIASVEAKVVAFEKTHPDFKEKVRENRALSSNQLHPVAGRMVAKSEYVAELLYAFGSDSAMAIRVAKMDPEDQALVVSDMINKIKAEKKATVKPATPQGGAKPAGKKSITQAPPPPRATPAGGRTQARDPLDPNVGMDDFARQHRAGKQSARDSNRKQRGLA